MKATLSFFYALSFLAVAAAVLFAAYLAAWVRSRPRAGEEVESSGELIRSGANAFIKKEYKLLARFASAGGSVFDNLTMAAAYAAGTVISAITGKLGILVATAANTRTARAATEGIKPAFLIGFRGGSVMGLGVVSMSLLGVMLVLMTTKSTTALLGFSFGASSLALFAKAGGGIFTKTADISADLVGKVEMGIPEDDPRNPAVIADNVGDTVGDLFKDTAGPSINTQMTVVSLVASLVSTVFLQFSIF